ncbi:OLC1v1033834C2 [Oldenlandia corymbosa var. corymbosa]|uniref:U6 small nuclear RNA (adenine-(43)-N(6))-methyltransferase n=1 Tax=Oldenlandia corymbosa var. corymbosa TaxID=529605 RepID=A0AAV1CPU7_OLDCO|nr:OLC1v1033834C2 [Oldenlandia corymbosa var. corymbosa]
MPSKKRKRVAERGTIHPRNKYSEKPPDFGALASLYPSFEPYVFYSSKDGRPRIDWTDYNATRELTRVLLLHDHGLNWWIPDGQLCPTVPNRSNYIHWIEDLLASDIILNTRIDDNVVKGFDIGTGANCIYPLLGASLLGWRFVGSDITDVALEWAERNVRSNPHISELIEIRKVHTREKNPEEEDVHAEQGPDSDDSGGSSNRGVAEIGPSCLPSAKLQSSAQKKYQAPPILLGVVKDEEKFDFCMCNPPFFETMEEAGLNPKTACGGTKEEMVCPGGEQAFIARIIEDSVQLKQCFRWYTSMIGRKSNLKFLIAKLREVGVTVVKTTEFVQGQTCRWGLAWSFVPPSGKILSSQVSESNNKSFMLEVIASKDQCESMLTSETEPYGALSYQHNLEMPDVSNQLDSQSIDLHFSISVFQQIPGTLLVKGTLQQKGNPNAGAFSLVFSKLEAVLKAKFCKPKPIAELSRSKQQR